MITRRHFLVRGSLAAGSAMFANTLALASQQGRKATQASSPRYRGVDTGKVRVLRGPWQILPSMLPGVSLENLYLVMPDGAKLNAFLYTPTNIESNKSIPAIIGTDPYRYLPQDDSANAREGYASLYVDVRGTGGSDGVPTDEYSHQEHEDTNLIIDWLSRQPWCNGNVGMYGGSYGAINALQMAYELNPPALKAVFLMCGTDSRYTDDIHFPGGSMLMVDNSWALGMLAMNAMPGAPDFNLHDEQALDRWNQPPWLQGFLHNQLYSDYWRHGSLAPDYTRLTTPAYIVGGYLDIYQNQVMRIMRNSTGAETRGLLGPWHHSLDTPGPAVDLQALMIRWFDHWLKGKDTGMLEEPRASFFLPSWRRQSFRFEDDVPGEWRYLDEWPDSAYDPGTKLFFRPNPERSLTQSLDSDPALGTQGRLTELAGPAAAQRLRYSPGTGSTDQSFGPTSGEGYYGLDRRAEDAFAHCFDTPELQEPVEILGFTQAKLFVASSAPVTNWIVRLCDLAPDGSSYLIARGILNGTHRNSHSEPEPLAKDEIYELDIELMCTAYRFEPGHRVRISISNADFPVLWPSPEPLSTTLYTGGDRASHIRLPTIPAINYRTGALPPLTTGKYRNRVATYTGSEPWYEIARDLQKGVTRANFNLPLGGNIRCRVADDAPGSASMTIDTNFIEKADDRVIECHSTGTLASSPTHFQMDISVSLRENGTEVRSRRWRESIKRELV